jgi:chitinase
MYFAINQRISFMAHIILAISFFCLLSFENNAQSVIAYYSGNARDIDRYPVEKLTHIIYSFCHLKGNRLYASPGDSITIKKLAGLKRKYPGLKILLSLGGWGGCKTCSPVFSTAAGREAFAISVAELTNYFSTDGIDIDWEFPAAEGYPGHPYSAADRDNFTALIAMLRQQLGKGKEISFLAACFSPYLRQSIYWKAVMALADRANLMTYDIIGSRNKLTGHHANLYSTSWQQESADNAIRYLDSLDIPPGKIAIGVAFYGREFTGVPSAANGLHQPGRFKRFVTMKEIRKNFTAKNGYTIYWDKEAQAPYIYNPSRKTYLTYDDERSVEAKAAYVKEKQLNGIMFWELRLDTPQNGLLDKIHQALTMLPAENK